MLQHDLSGCLPVSGTDRCVQAALDACVRHSVSGCVMACVQAVCQYFLVVCGASCAVPGSAAGLLAMKRPRALAAGWVGHGEYVAILATWRRDTRGGLEHIIGPMAKDVG